MRGLRLTLCPLAASLELFAFLAAGPIGVQPFQASVDFSARLPCGAREIGFRSYPAVPVLTF